MYSAEQFQTAVEELKKVAEQVARGELSDPLDPASFEEAKTTVLERYQPVFSPENLPHLTEREFRSFLAFKNNLHWSGLERQGSRICRDMPALRQNLAILLDESRPISERYDTAVPNILGMGKAIATAILLVSNPKRYAVWNRKSQEALQIVNLWPDQKRKMSEGQIYEQINQVCFDLAAALETDIWTLDAYWHFLLVSREHSAADLEDDDFESESVTKEEAVVQEVQDYLRTLDPQASPAEIEQQIWSAADELRADGRHTAQQYFVPVIGLIFLRYLDHRYLQTDAKITQQVMEMSSRRRSGVDIPALFKADGSYYLTETSRFTYLVSLAQQSNTEGLGLAVNQAITQIEAENIQLRDIVGKNFDTLDNDILATLIRTIGQLQLDQNGEPLKRIYQAFLNKMGYTAAYTTPRLLSKLITQILNPTNGRVLDPALGTGGLLIAMADYATHNKHKKNISLYGQELDGRVARIAKMNLIMSGYEADIRLGDSLTVDPQQSLGYFQYAVADIPFDQKVPLLSDIENDPRYPFGVSRTADFFWLQHIYTALDKNGRGAVVTLESATSRLGAEQDIRRQLVQSGAVEAMITLPSSLMTGNHLVTVIWVFNKGRTHTDKLLFIDGRKLFHPQNNRLSDKQIQFMADMVRLFRGEKVTDPVTAVPLLEGEQLESRDFAEYFPQGTYEDIAGLCKTESLARIGAENWVLTPSRYVGEDALLHLSKILGAVSGLDEEIFHPLGELALEIRPFKPADDPPEKALGHDNTLYITLNKPTNPIVSNPADLDGRGEHLQLTLNKAKILAAYAAHILNSQHGVRVRQFSQSGATLNKLTRSQIEKLQLPLLPLAEQQAILETRHRLLQLEVTLNGLRDRLYSEPFKLEEVQQALDLLEGNRQRPDENYKLHDKPIDVATLSLDQWIDSLPYPLATILRTYTAKPSAKEKVEHLFSFFEAFSEFLVMVLLSGLKNDTTYYEEVIRPQMAEKFSGYHATWYMRPRFGNWVRVFGFLAKPIRSGLGNPQQADHMLNRFGQPDPLFLKALTQKELIPLLEKINLMRNEFKGHGGYMDDDTAPAQLRELEGALAKVRELIGPAFQTVQVIRPLPHKIGFSGGRFTCQIEPFHSSSIYFTPETIETAVPLDHDKLYLWTGEHADPIELPPLIRLQVEKNQIDCYFYNGSDKNAGSREATLVKWVCYHITHEPNQKIEDPAYLQTLDALLTVQPKT